MISSASLRFGNLEAPVPVPSLFLQQSMAAVAAGDLEAFF